MAITQHEEALQQLVEGYAQTDREIELQALVRYQSTESYQASLQSRYEDLHHWFFPYDGDQWPSDGLLRPGKIHATVNLIRPVVEIDARLQSIPPRYTIPTMQLTAEEKMRAEAAEVVMLEWLELSGQKLWLHTLNQTRSIYGKGVLKPFWDDSLQRGDVIVIENPANIRFGWGSSDYTKIDWALYEYSLSHHEAMQRWDIRIEPGERADQPPNVVTSRTDHADPLDQKGHTSDFWRPRFRNFSDYERSQVKVWDYWYKDESNTVRNAIMVQGTLVEENPHAYMPDIPYIPIENDHEPASPEGISTIEPLIDLQEEINRLISHGFQHIADDVDPAWYATGPSAEALEPGLVPKAGEIIGLGENTLELVPKGVNTFPINDMLDQAWAMWRRVSGVSDIAFGDPPSADTSGRALAIQVEAMMNRLDQRRSRLYQGLKDLLVFWTIMAERKNPPVEVREGESVGLKDLIGGFRFWKIVAPEITPRDSFEVAQNEIQKVQAKLTSLRKAMDATGEEAPEHELSVVAREHSDINIHPESVQIQLAVESLKLQLAQQFAELQAMQQQNLQQPGGGTPQSVLAQSQGAVNQAQEVQQGQGPAANFEDQNVPLPPTNQGSPTAPPGGGGPAGQTTQLIRPGQALTQLQFTQPVG